MDRKMITLGVLVLAGLLGGCAQPEATKKEAMRQQYADNSLAARLPMAGDLLDRGQIAQARRTLNECISGGLNNPLVHVMDGRILCAEGQIDRAYQAFEKAVAMDEKCDSAWFYMGALEQSQGRHDKALAHYQQAVSLSASKFRYVLAVADTLALLDRCDEAAVCINNTLLHSRDGDVLAQAGSIAARCGRVDEAVNLYKTAIGLKPSNKGILESLAGCYQLKKDWTAAAETYEKLLKTAASDEERATYLTPLAACRYNAGQFQMAWQCYDQLTILDRGEFRHMLGMAQSSLGMGLTEQARREAARVLKASRDNPEAIVVIGCADFMDEQYQKAIASFSKLISDDRQSGFAWWMTGHCHKQMGNMERADAAFQIAATLRPDSLLMQRIVNDKSGAL